MGTTQLSALTKKPYYGLDYGAIVKAKAASLPAAYAATEDAEYNQDVLKNANAGVAIQQEALNVDKQEKENQLKYYNDMTALSAQEADAAKSNATTGNMLGMLGTGVSAYGAYKNSLLAEKLASASGVTQEPGLISKGLTGIKDALGLNSSTSTNPVTTSLGEATLATKPSTPALVADAASVVAPEVGGLAASTASNAGLSGTAATGTYIGEGAAYGTNALASEGAAYGANAVTPGISGTAGTGTYVGEGAAYGAGKTGALSSTAKVAGNAIAYIAAAEMARGQWGGAGIPYEEKTKQQRTVDSPGTAGVMASLAPGTLLAPDGTVAGRAAKNMAALERTVMAPIDYAFGDDDAFNKETLNTATNAILNPFSDADEPSTAGQVANAVLNPLGAIGNLFCFLAGTPITMSDGTTKPVEDVGLMEDCAEGGMVTGIGIVLAKDIFNYEGIGVTGSHAVYEDGEWKRVKNSKYAAIVDSDLLVKVYIINNEKHTLMVNGIRFADYGEVTDSENMTAQQRLDYLNEYCRI